MSETVVIDCPYCKTKVRAEVLKKKQYPATDEHDPHRIFFLECPDCMKPMMAGSESVPIGLRPSELPYLTKSGFS